jgi:hypothetical protein
MTFIKLIYILTETTFTQDHTYLDCAQICPVPVIQLFKLSARICPVSCMRSMWEQDKSCKFHIYSIYHRGNGIWTTGTGTMSCNFSACWECVWQIKKLCWENGFERIHSGPYFYKIARSALLQPSHARLGTPICFHIYGTDIYIY